MEATTRKCEWCGEELVPWSQRTARTCSKSCRQKLARFRVAPAGSAADKPMRFAYADPPYPGMSWRYYKGEEVDHEKLIDRLFLEFHDGWALSTSAKSAIEVTGIVRRLAAYHGVDLDSIRLCPWVNGSFPCESYYGRVSWEPLIIVGGRPKLRKADEILDDSLIWSGRQDSMPGALIGMKPPAFCEWMFRLWGAASNDTLVDIFPGSGAVAKAWAMYTRDPSTVHAKTKKRSRLAGAQSGDPNERRR